MPSLIIMGDGRVSVSRALLAHSPLLASDVKTFAGIDLGAESPSRIAALFVSGINTASTVTLNGYPLSLEGQYPASLAALYSGAVPTGSSGVDLIITLPANIGYVGVALYVLRGCRSAVPASTTLTSWSTPTGTGTFTTTNDLTGVPRGSGMVAAAFPLQNNYTMALSSPNISSDGQVAHTILGGFMDSGHGVATAAVETITYSVTKSSNGFAHLAAAAFR